MSQCRSVTGVTSQLRNFCRVLRLRAHSVGKGSYLVVTRTCGSLQCRQAAWHDRCTTSSCHATERRQRLLGPSHETRALPPRLVTRPVRLAKFRDPFKQCVSPRCNARSDFLVSRKRGKAQSVSVQCHSKAASRERLTCTRAGRRTVEKPGAKVRG